MKINLMPGDVVRVTQHGEVRGPYKVVNPCDENNMLVLDHWRFSWDLGYKVELGLTSWFDVDMNLKPS